VAATVRSRSRRRLAVLCTVFTTVSVTAGCSLAGRPSGSGPEVSLWPVGAALHGPVWSYRTHSLIALTDDNRLAAASAGSRPGDASHRVYLTLADAPFVVSVAKPDL
jgi:hypothetical protein